MVFNVEAEYLPNGNRRSRPVVADDMDEARMIAQVDWDIKDNDPLIVWRVAERPDPEGNLERMLQDAERRRLEAEFYKR